MDPLHGSRVSVRPFTVGDVDGLHAYRDDQETARYQGWEVPYSREAAATFVTWASTSTLGVPGSWCQLAVEAAGTTELVGDVAVHRPMDEPNVAEIGVTLSPAARGRGLATEAVALVLDRLAARGVAVARAYILAENVASVALFERLGFARVSDRVAEDGLTEQVYERNLAETG